MRRSCSPQLCPILVLWSMEKERKCWGERPWLWRYCALAMPPVYPHTHCQVVGS